MQGFAAHSLARAFNVLGNQDGHQQHPIIKKNEIYCLCSVFNRVFNRHFNCVGVKEVMGFNRDVYSSQKLYLVSLFWNNNSSRSKRLSNNYSCKTNTFKI